MKMATDARLSAIGYRLSAIFALASHYFIKDRKKAQVHLF